MEQVAIGTTVPAYNAEPPFHPDTNFPELPFTEISSQPNAPYSLLRDLFFQLQYDSDNFNTPNWNPLGFLVKPGQVVVLKPNFVTSFNYLEGEDVFAVITHPSILRVLIDYIYIALKGTGRIIIADAPQMDCNWEELMRIQRIDKIQEFYRSKFGFEIEIYDLRNFCLIDAKERAYAGNRKDLPGDPLGSLFINLGVDSEFYGLANENYYGADFNRQETIAHHKDKVHEYCVSKTILSADVFISVPKMKVHKKVGVTLNLKGLVGINTNKNCLIHYRIGTPKEGGDQLPDEQPASDRLVIKVQRYFYDKALAKKNVLGDMLYKLALGVYRITIKPFRHVSESTSLLDEGNWHGNDSAWRMTTDLAKILFFADKDGILYNMPQRKIFCVIDGIMGGENNGPLGPDVKMAGSLVCGENPLAVDLVATRLMGFDYKKIKKFHALINSKKYDFGVKSIDEINVVSKDETMRQLFISKNTFLSFRPHPGWVGHIEI